MRGKFFTGNHTDSGIIIGLRYADINTETGEILNIQKVGRSTAWKDVPTPAI